MSDTLAPTPIAFRSGSWHQRAAAACQRAVEAGAPPDWFGWRWIRQETLERYAARGGRGTLETIHEATLAANPLPLNVDRDDLPRDPDWFGFSFHDVPNRVVGPTRRATLEDATVVTFRDLERDEFWPAIVTRDRTALALREVTFRRGHTEQLRNRRDPVRVRRATWFLERVYENHSHWLTAHLPKLVLLKARGELGDVVLPARRTPVIDASLALLGIDPAHHPVHDPGSPLRAEALTVLETDRFRPELLRPVRDAIAPSGAAPWRRVYISRKSARIRRLVNETALEPLLGRAGFEPVTMESLDFSEQIQLMAETRVLLAPHGAGLTNMMFCPEGSHVIEIADRAYPNPNFYALASAMGLNYWHVPARLTGPEDRHRLDRDLAVEPAALEAVLHALEAET